MIRAVVATPAMRATRSACSPAHATSRRAVQRRSPAWTTTWPADSRIAVTAAPVSISPPASRTVASMARQTDV